MSAPFLSRLPIKTTATNRTVCRALIDRLSALKGSADHLRFGFRRSLRMYFLFLLLLSYAAQLAFIICKLNGKVNATVKKNTTAQQ
jgi:hypothetical protein